MPFYRQRRVTASSQLLVTGQGLYRAALPQLPVTLLNAVISTAKLADDLFPDDGLNRTPVPVSKISLSIGFMNSLSAAFGHFPSCHGCGGLEKSSIVLAQ